MAKMTKTSYHVTDREGCNLAAKLVEGYVVEKLVAGTVMRFGVRKYGKSWTVDDVATGMSVNPGRKFGKRAEALAYVDDKDAQTGRSLVESMEGYLEKKPHTYRAQAEAMRELAKREEPWSVKEMNKYVDERARELAKAAKAAPKAPKPPAPPEQSPAVVEAAIVVSSETMAKWCEERGLTFNQKREGCPMWVHGASKPYKDELLEMGFRWGCSKTWGKGWYRRVA